MRLADGEVPTITTPHATARGAEALSAAPDYRGSVVTQRAAALPAGLVPTAWTASAVDPHSRRLVLQWIRDACTREVARTVLFVDERPDEVVIDVWQDEHWVPGTVDCVASAQSQTATVKLRVPLGRRALHAHWVPVGTDGFASADHAPPLNP